MTRGNPFTIRCSRCYRRYALRTEYGEPQRTGRTRERTVSNGRRQGTHRETQHELTCARCGHTWWSHHERANRVPLVTAID